MTEQTYLPATPNSIGLTERERVFVHLYAESRNPLLAFTQSHDVEPGTTRPVIYRRAAEVLKRPHVRLAIIQAQDALQNECIIRAAQILQDLVDIADADPNELIKVERFNCRHCHGVDFKYQWVDATELARAWDDYRVKLAAFKSYKGKGRPVPPKPPHDASGGFGYQIKGDPAPMCPHCYGEGIARETVGDTTKLSVRARKLYAGAEVKPDGTVKILMHDQLRARDMVIKMLGAYKDGKGIQGTGTQDAEPIPATASADEAQRAYLKLKG